MLAVSVTFFIVIYKNIHLFLGRIFSVRIHISDSTTNTVYILFCFHQATQREVPVSRFTIVYELLSPSTFH
jgi:multisubunit Na+/H+ antiporter MnhF subunit